MNWLVVIPNAISLGRLVLAAAFPFLPESWRLGVVVAAGLSDLVDGDLSRRFQVTTRIGGMLDAVADKAFVLSVAVTLLVEDHLHFVELLLVAFRDLVVLAGLGWLAIAGTWEELRQLPPRMLGKFATVAQFLFLCGILGWPEWRAWFFYPTALLSALAADDYASAFLARRAMPRR